MYLGVIPVAIVFAVVRVALVAADQPIEVTGCGASLPATLYSHVITAWNAIQVC